MNITSFNRLIVALIPLLLANGCLTVGCASQSRETALSAAVASKTQKDNIKHDLEALAVTESLNNLKAVLHSTHEESVVMAAADEYAKKLSRVAFLNLEYGKTAALDMVAETYIDSQKSILEVWADNAKKAQELQAAKESNGFAPPVEVK